MRRDVLHLDPEDREQLQYVIQAYTTPDHIRRRASILLLAEQGMTYTEIAREVGMDRSKVKPWIDRYENREPGTPVSEVLKTLPKNHCREIPLEAYQWVKDLVAAHDCKTILEATDLVHREAEAAGYPRLANASYSKIRAILKSE